MRDVCVIGLGTVGLPTAIYIATMGEGRFKTYGYDLKPVNSPLVKSTTRWDRIPHHNISIYVICVWVGLDKDWRPDLTALHDVCEKIAKTNPGALVSIESTVPPGTCRNISAKYGLQNIIHVPHRYWAGDPVNHGVRQLRVFGYLNKESMMKGLIFYRDILSIPLHVVEPIEVAEMCKIVENAYRFVQIAFAEELKMICSELGLDFESVRSACNTKWNIEILEARNGIGGKCLPKDIRFLISLCKKVKPFLLKSAIKTDEVYKRWVRRIGKEGVALA